jgi:hypothetical protein
MHRTIAATTVALLLSGVPAECAHKKALTFQSGSMGEIEDKPATDAGFHTRWWSVAHFGFTVLKASNGSTLTVYYDDFTKPEEAKRFLDWNADKSFKVLSRSTKTHADSKQIEYRAELVPEWDHSDVEVMWVVGVAVHWIDAPTLEDALELERQYRK